jgi:hypothetical protein
MREAVIVSAARTPIGRANRGAFNRTHGAELGGHVIRHAVARAGVDPAEVEDVLLGCGGPEGATGFNIGRQAAIRAGLPVSAAGAMISRDCSSGMQAIATAAARAVTTPRRVQIGSVIAIAYGWGRDGANSTGRLPTELSESGRIDTPRSGPQAGKSVGICESGFGFRLIDRLGRSLRVRQNTGDPISGSGSGETR